jgi:hypothetical protein
LELHNTSMKQHVRHSGEIMPRPTALAGGLTSTCGPKRSTETKAAKESPHSQPNGLATTGRTAGQAPCVILFGSTA